MYGGSKGASLPDAGLGVDGAADGKGIVTPVNKYFLGIRYETTREYLHETTFGQQ